VASETLTRMHRGILFIELVDPLRKTRVRFETPDNRYVPFDDDKDIAGMYKIVKLQHKSGPRKK
jgi:hypothetical protein